MNRLAILRSVTAAISRENNLDRILSLAADNIIEADGIDGVLIYLKIQVKNEIELKQYRGISPETAQQFNRIQTEDRLQEYFASRAQYKDNAGKVITCNFLAELKAQQKTAGMLCILSASAAPLK